MNKFKRLPVPLPVMILIMALLSINAGRLFAQPVEEEFKKLTVSDTTDMRLLATYPEAVRDNFLVLCKHPESIARLSDIQKTSAASFRNVIKDFSKEDQSRIWNLTRYDQLISKLKDTKGKSKKINSVLKEFPEIIHEDARWMATEHQSILNEIDNVSRTFNTSFQELQKQYSTENQQALAALIKTPEVISLLNDNMRMAVYLGDLYNKNPEIVQQQFDSLNLVVAAERVAERDALKQAINDDPAAAAELKKSTEDFAKENGYAESEYKSGQPNVITEYVYVPYPYWFGYPWWYDVHYWYPYPYWYHWGFYYSGNIVVWISPPSWYYMHWHFYYPHHYYDYPHLSNVYINNYYYGHRRTHGSNSRVVSQFMQNHETVLPDDFKEATELRVDRIRELGKAEIDRTTFLKNNPGATISKEEFIRERPDNYPALKKPARIPPSVEPPIRVTPEKRPMELPPKTPPVQPKPPVPKRHADPQPPVIRTPDKQSPVKTLPPPSRPTPPKEPVRDAPRK